MTETLPPAPRATVNAMLRNSARLPSFDNKMPKSMVLLYQEWENKELHTYAHLRTGTYSAAQAWRKRHYLAKYVEKVYNERGLSSKLEAAQVIDRERGRDTLTTLMTKLKRGDNNIRRRAAHPQRRRPIEQIRELREQQQQPRHRGNIGLGRAGEFRVAAARNIAIARR